MKFLLCVAAVTVTGIFSFTYAATNPIQRIIDCRNPANSGQCAGNLNLMDGNLRNMGQPGMTARIPGFGILQGLCSSLGVSCAGSTSVAGMQADIWRLEYLKSMYEDMRRDEAANLARLAEARRLADEAARAAAARAVTTGQSQEYSSGGTTQVNSVLTCGMGILKSRAFCQERFGCRWDPSGRGRCVAAE